MLGDIEVVRPHLEILGPCPLELACQPLIFDPRNKLILIKGTKISWAMFWSFFKLVMGEMCLNNRFKRSGELFGSILV